MEVRKARLSDAESIHKLSWQLGYRPDLETTKLNIERMLTHPDYELVVAINTTDQVIGWMSLTVRYRIEDVAFLQVAALVTDEAVCGRGAGRLLMAYADRIAQSRKLPFVGLHSSKPRTAAHAFYEHLGYARAKESLFFRKDVE